MLLDCSVHFHTSTLMELSIIKVATSFNFIAACDMKSTKRDDNLYVTATKIQWVFNYQFTAERYMQSLHFRVKSRNGNTKW